MREVIGYKTELMPFKQCRITDSAGTELVSGNAVDILAFIAGHDSKVFHIVYNLDEFMKPIKELMPADVYKELFEKERVTWQGLRLFYPEINGGILGINYKNREHIQGNIYKETKQDITVYDIAHYFSGEPCETALDVKSKATELLLTLQRMGFTPDKLTTSAAIYEQCILSKLPYATIYTLPDDSLDMMEWAMNYIREWRSVYKIGIFPYGVAKDYDITSAYPSIIAGLPNMTDAEFYYSPDGIIPVNAEWGLIRANIDVKSDVSLLVCDDGICRKGKRVDLISNEEMSYCIQTGQADIEPLEAWYFTIPKRQFIFDYSMRKLYNLRNGNALRDTIAKAMSVSVWGKMHQMINDKPGQYCNFIYAAMVASRCRLKVMQFIDDNNLQDDIVSITVDGCIATKEIPEIPNTKTFGEWRVNPDSEAIILDTNFQWIGDKHQLGITASDLIKEIQKHPGKQYWKNIHLALLEHDRQYNKLPKNGHDLLKQTYLSRMY
jgi:hypothetical protein